MTSHCTFPDGRGVEVRARRLSTARTYGALIEGNPAQLTDEIVKEILPESMAEWGEATRVILNSNIRVPFATEPILQEVNGIAWLEAGGRRVVAGWFQPDADPFAMLAHVMGRLDWADLTEDRQLLDPGFDPVPKLVKSDCGGVKVWMESISWQESLIDFPDRDEKEASLHSMSQLGLRMRKPGKLLVTPEHRRMMEEKTRVVPPERVIVHLKSDWQTHEEDWYTHFHAAWFQNPGHPGNRLDELLPQIDWKKDSRGWYP